MSEGKLFDLFSKREVGIVAICMVSLLVLLSFLPLIFTKDRSFILEMEGDPIVDEWLGKALGKSSVVTGMRRTEEVSEEGFPVYEINLTIDTLPRFLDDLQTPIDPKWYLREDSMGFEFYETGVNLGSARVDRNYVSVQDEFGRLTAWDTDFKLGDRIFTLPEVQLLGEDPINSYYYNNTLLWDYGHGVKRHLRVIEGLIQEYWLFEQNPFGFFGELLDSGEIHVLRESRHETSFSGTLSDVAVFDASAVRETVKIRGSPSEIGIHARDMKGKKFPIILDPTYTFTQFSSASDGDIFSADASYGTVHSRSEGYVSSGNTFLDVGQGFYAGSYDIVRAFLFFDTSAVPSGVEILHNQSDLQIYGRGQIIETSGVQSYVRVQTGMPTYPRDPLQASDYNKIHYDGTFIGEYRVDSTFWKTTGYNSFELISSAFSSAINPNGITKFALRQQNDCIYAIPSELQYVSFWAYEKGMGYQPKLTVTYQQIIEPPAISNMEVLSSGQTVASVKAKLTADGGESCSVNFQYSKTSNFATYWETSVQSGKTEGSEISASIVGLDAGTLYYVKAVAVNTSGSSSSSVVSFLTSPASPVDFLATSGGGEIALSWTKGSGADRLMIRFSNAAYPQDRETGTQIYFDDGTSYDHTDLTPNENYFYTAWSEITAGGFQRFSSAVFSATVPTYAGPPSISTEAATSVGEEIATLNAILSAMNQIGGTVAISFFWGKTNEGEVDVEWDHSSAADNSPMSGVGPSSLAISSLDPATQYFFVVKAVGDEGVSYGDVRSFTTGGVSAPSMQTLAATGVTLTSGILHGKVSSDGGEYCTVWFRWGYSESMLVYSTSVISGLLTNDTFLFSLGSLSPGTEYFFQAVGENSSGGRSYGEVLSFETESPSLPEVTTRPATFVGATSATLSGRLDLDGGVPSSVRFQWSLYANLSEEVYETGWQTGKVSGERFEAVLSGLSIGETYFFRAESSNSTGSSVGSVLDFTTVFSAPGEFSAKPIGSQTVALSWERQGSQTFIYYRTDRFPIDRLDGTLVYSGTAESATHDLLTPGVTYFYRAWSWQEGNIWSDEYSEDVCSTWGVTLQEDRETPEITSMPGMPEDMYADPQYGNLSNLPGYEQVNSAADALGMPRGHFWLFLSFAIVIGFALMIFIPTQNALLALIVLSVGLLAFSWMGPVPYWIFFVFVIFGGGGYYALGREA